VVCSSARLLQGINEVVLGLSLAIGTAQVNGVGSELRRAYQPRMKGCVDSGSGVGSTVCRA